MFKVFKELVINSCSCREFIVLLVGGEL